MVKEKINKQVIPMIFFVIMCIYTITLFIPLIWMIFTSLKDILDFGLNPFGLPEKWHFDNYILVFNKMYLNMDVGTGLKPVYLPQLFLNSLAWSVVSALSQVFGCCICAYVVAKYRFKFGNILYSIVIVTMILPIVGSLPSSLNVHRMMHTYDNFWGLAICKFSFSGGNFLIFYATFKGISWEYAEAAFIDGASHFKVMVNIMIPLAKTTVLALWLLSFISHWNEWEATLIYIPSFPVAAYALYKFQNNKGNDTAGVPFIMCSCMWMTIPIVILFIAFRDKLMGSITMGGLKG